MERLSILLLSVVLLGCGSRRKTVESVKSSFSFENSIDTSFRFSSALIAEALTNYNYTASSLHKMIEYDGQQGDSMMLEQYGADGKLQNKLVISGKGKATITEGQHTEQVKASNSQSHQEQGSGEASGTQKTKAAAAQEDLKKQVKSDWSILSLWWVAVLFGVLWYLNKRYRWLPKIKSHVTGWLNQ